MSGRQVISSALRTSDGNGSCEDGELFQLPQTRILKIGPPMQNISLIKISILIQLNPQHNYG